MASTKIHFKTLDALRGVCAILVCLFHFNVLGIPKTIFIRSSWVFVDFFFVLSGFVMMHNYGNVLGKKISTKGFMKLRFWRLYPLHISLLILFVIVEIVGYVFLSNFMNRSAFADHYDLTSLILNVFMLHSFGLTDSLTWNHPSWSIAVEFWTYLLFALAIVYLKSKYIKFTMLLSIIITFFLLLIVTDLGINVTWDYGMLRCIYGFSMGVLGYKIWQHYGSPVDNYSSYNRTIIEIIMIMVVIFSTITLSYGRISLILPVIFLITLLTFTGNGGGVTSLLQRRFALYLGMISYSIYMVHVFVQARLEDVLRLIFRLVGIPASYLDGGTAFGGTFLSLLMLALVIVVSHFCYHYIEKPGIAYGKRRRN